MAFKIISRLLLTSITLLSCGAHSATLTYSLTGAVVTPGSYFGTVGTGSFSYDDADITGIGTETISAAGSSLTVEFTIFGQTFTDTDDVGNISTGAPDLTLSDGVPVFLDFLISEVPDPPDFNLVAIDEPGVIYIDIWDPSGINLTPVAGGFETDVSVGVVPIPAAIWLFGSGLVGLTGIARRKKV